ncbi:DUF488 domain-containing protein, partial [Methanococcoides sp. SA1]|nr:DUF488 domain-containing protein [Methanococcoides sp. SA1]
MQNFTKAKSTIYTIGHSTHELEYFLEMLDKYNINCVVDIRSLPASRFNPQYNKKNIHKSLGENGIDYIHMPKEFGAWQSTPELLDDENILDFEKVRESTSFKIGIKRISNG